MTTSCSRVKPDRTSSILLPSRLQMSRLAQDSDLSHVVGFETQSTSSQGPSRMLTMALAVISEAGLLRRKPPFLPLTATISPFVFSVENICSRYFSEMPCLLAISERKTGFPSLWWAARSIIARRPYLPFVDTFIFVSLSLGYI